MADTQIFTFPPKSIIFREGEETTEMYIIISGQVKIIKGTGDGTNLVLADLGPGAMVGEMSLISGRPRSATVQAITEVKTKVIAREIFQKSAAGVPAWAMCIAQVLIERLRQTNIILKKHANIEIFQDSKNDKIQFSNKFAIEYNEVEQPHMAFLRGYFFSYDVEELDNFINNLIRKKIKLISLDCSEIIDIDSTGIEYLINLTKRLKRSNIEFSLHNVQLIHTKISTSSTLNDVITTLSPPRKNIPAGTCLMQQGERSETMYIVKSGRFKISRWVGNREISFAEVGAGDVIGEMTLIAGGTRSASVTALKPGIVYEISKSDIHDNRFNIPNWFLRIIQQLISRIRDSEEILDKIVKKEEPEIEQVGIEIDYIPDKSMAGIFKLNGELTAENRASFKNQIIRLINSGFYNIILDFSNIHSMDDTFLPLLDKIAAFLVSKNGKLHFANANMTIAAMLKKGITNDRGRAFHDNLDELITPALLDKYFDQLTGLYSQDYFRKAIVDEVERCKRYKSILSVLSISIDYNKDNDESQKSNSFFQKEIAEYIKSRFRKVDIAARTGDKLFQIILPGTNVQDAKNVAEEFCKTVNKQEFKQNNDIVRLFCNCGISTFNKEEDAESILTRSRDALYEAKKKGKNTVIVFMA